jgi:hypothetical protein
VQDREHHNTLGLDAVEDSIRKARNDGAANLPVNPREHLWIALDGVEDGINGIQESLAKPRAFPS